MTPAADALPLDELRDALADTVAGAPREEAAVGVLVDEQHWLQQPEFVNTYVFTFDEAGKTMAGVRWDRIAADLTAHKIHGTAQQLTLLRLAAAIHGPYRIALADLTYLGEDATRTAVQALTHLMQYDVARRT